MEGLLIDWLIDNKEWIFSGAGLVVVSWIIKLIFSKKETGHTFTQTSGDNSTNIQGKNVKIQNDKKEEQ